MRIYIFGARFLPVDDFFDILFSDAKTIAVSESALQEHFNGNGETSHPVVIELLNVIVVVFFASDFDIGQELIKWIMLLFLHQKYL